MWLYVCTQAVIGESESERLQLNFKSRFTFDSALVPAMAPGKSNKSAASQQQNQRLKIVVRRLPPDLPEHVFWKSVSPWITRETAVQDTAEAGSSTDLPSQAEAVSWSKFKPGKIRKQ